MSAGIIRTALYLISSVQTVILTPRPRRYVSQGLIQTSLVGPFSTRSALISGSAKIEEVLHEHVADRLGAR